MFVGHYGPGFAAAGARRGPSLGAACIAVQLVDYAWAAFILTGVEHARVTPGFTALSPLDLYDMPFTHSLVAALAWSALGGLVYALIDRRNARAAVWIGLCVFSHWILDWVVHQPDLLLWGNLKVGLGLWSNAAAGVAAELGVLGLGFVAYVMGSRPKGRAGAIVPWAVLAVLLALAGYNWLGPVAADSHAVAVSCLMAYTLIAALGFALDATRAPLARPA